LTVLWGIGLVIAGGLQAVGTSVAGMSITDPIGFLVRTAVGVGAEALLFFLSVSWLRGGRSTGWRRSERRAVA
jgi:hypothetical protein